MPYLVTWPNLTSIWCFTIARKGSRCNTSVATIQSHYFYVLCIRFEAASSAICSRMSWFSSRCLGAESTSHSLNEHLLWYESKLVVSYPAVPRSFIYCPALRWVRRDPFNVKRLHHVPYPLVADYVKSLFKSTNLWYSYHWCWRWFFITIRQSKICTIVFLSSLKPACIYWQFLSSEADAILYYCQHEFGWLIRLIVM